MEAEEVTPKKAEYCGSAPSVPVSEVLRPGSGVWRVRYKPADYLSLNTPALMAAAGQGDSKLWTPYTLSNFLLGHFLSLRECFWHQQQ